MKSKLLLLSIFISSLSFSQQISSFKSPTNTDFTLLSPPPSTISQSASGANSTWTFSALSESGTTKDTYATPTGLETTTYPGTTEVLSISTQATPPTVNKFFLKETGTEISITGVQQETFSLNYSTNTLIGSFPMSYTNTNTTSVAGTFSYNDAGISSSGIFYGTANVSVDAYGILNFGTYNKSVTRLRIEQTLTLAIGAPPSVLEIGGMTLITYYYYNNDTNNLDFRYNSTSLIINQGINITSETESLEFNKTENDALSVSNYTLASNISVSPNPAEDFISIKMPKNEAIKSLKVIDNQGKEVLVNSESTNLINIANLQSGLYFLSIETESGKLAIKKLIKP